MTLLENEITQKNVELAKKSPELLNRHEHEVKLIPTSAEAFQEYREVAVPIEQSMLNAYGEEFELRVRCTYSPEGNVYTATLKDQGEIKDDYLDRLEVETEITKEAYDYYAQQDRFPNLRQLRAPIADGLTIDFIEGESLPILELETKDPIQREAILHSLGDSVKNLSGDYDVSKNYLAHKQANFEYTYSPEQLETFAKRIAKEMVAHYVCGKNTVVAGLTGMSGSGKTTVTKFIHEALTERFGEEFAPLVISTDDYHFGKTHLDSTYGAPWAEWDDPRTYNTAELARDLEGLKQGASLIRRHFSFETEEPIFDDETTGSPFVIIEGLYAGSKDLAEVRDLHFELPTGIATGIGRDIRRLIVENRANRAFPTPESRLRYQIETALPLYLAQERPSRNSFSESVRPLAERAIMLSNV